MKAFLQDLERLLQAYPWVWSLTAAVSVLVFLGTLFLLPVLVVRMRPDYFSRPHRARGRWRQLHPIFVGLILLGKNGLGAILVIVGMVMLLTPGQGLITILIGLSLLNYPGKYRMERWFVTRRPVWRTVSWIRKRAAVEPLERPAKD